MVNTATIPVIIPARNEESTIGAIVRTFNEHPATADNVHVIIDADTWDETSDEVLANGGFAYVTSERGKGQLVRAGLSEIRRRTNPRIILCDADYTGLTAVHIDKLIRIPDGMTIGIPEWPEMEVPHRVTRSWPRVSGFRYLPRNLIPLNAHGYLLETQINVQAVKSYVPTYLVFMDGLKVRFQWPLSEKRRAELARDREWGERAGIL